MCTFKDKVADDSVYSKIIRLKLDDDPLQHIWALPVLHYPIIMVIYHYAPIGVIDMVMLHVFIIKKI